MRGAQGAELQRLNAEIVGYLLNQRSPPRELIAQRDRLRGAEQPDDIRPRSRFDALRRFALS